MISTELQNKLFSANCYLVKPVLGYNPKGSYKDAIGEVTIDFTDPIYSADPISFFSKPLKRACNKDHGPLLTMQPYMDHGESGPVWGTNGGPDYEDNK